MSSECRHYIFKWFHLSSIPLLWTWYLRNVGREFLQIWHKCLLELEHEHLTKMSQHMLSGTTWKIHIRKLVFNDKVIVMIFNVHRSKIRFDQMMIVVKLLCKKICGLSKELVLLWPSSTPTESRYVHNKQFNTSLKYRDRGASGIHGHGWHVIEVGGEWDSAAGCVVRNQSSLSS